MPSEFHNRSFTIRSEEFHNPLAKFHNPPFYSFTIRLQSFTIRRRQFHNPISEFHNLAL